MYNLMTHVALGLRPHTPLRAVQRGGLWLVTDGKGEWHPAPGVQEPAGSEAELWELWLYWVAVEFGYYKAFMSTRQEIMKAMGRVREFARAPGGNTVEIGPYKF